MYATAVFLGMYRVIYDGYDRGYAFFYDNEMMGEGSRRPSTVCFSQPCFVLGPSEPLFVSSRTSVILMLLPMEVG